MAENLIKQHQLFLRKAESDLSAAKLLFKAYTSSDNVLDIETIFFHLQQCAEKLIKSLLSFNNVHIVKSHDIELLITKAKENSIALPNNVNNLIVLTEYAVDGRYSVIHDDIMSVDEFIELLDDFVLFVTTLIN